MDGDATQTTGGTTDVPILQEVATNPTLEVGTKTVLHKDADAVGKTEINVELHNITSTSKAKAGDSIKFTIGDAEIELKVKKADDPTLNKYADGTAAAAGKEFDLVEGQSYQAKDLALMIANKFNSQDSDKLIGRQAFTATATDNKIMFLQNNDPADRTEVVDANVEVKVEYVSNPNGNPVDYTMKIKPDAFTDGSSITIGGDKYTFGEANSDFENIHKLEDIPDGFETKKGYLLTYDATAGTLTIKDPNGKLGTPTVKYDGYDVALKTAASETKGADDTKASASFTMAGLPASYNNGDTLTITDGTDSETFTWNSTTNAWDAGNTPPNFTLTDNGNGKFTVASSKIGEAGNTQALAASTGVTFRYATGTQTETAFSTSGNAAAGTDITTGTLTLDQDPSEGTTIAWNGETWEYSNGTWGASTGTGDFVLTGTGKTLTISGKDNTVVDVTAAGAKDVTVTYADVTNTAAVNLAGGKDGTPASTKFDFSSSNLQNGDKIIITDVTGTTHEFIFDTDLTTTFGGANGLDAFVAGQTGTTGAADGVLPDGTNAAEAYTVTIDNTTNTVTVSSNVIGKPGTNVAGDAIGSHLTQMKIEVAKKQETTGEVSTAASADTITGTWNVQSTKNKQGASADSGQLASTTFDFTADMAQDGNSLTIGKETYVFKVGKDSTVKAGAGETIVDLSNVEADDPDFVNKAMAALKNAALNNGAFTVGGAKDSGKISIHEKEGQTVFTNGELNSVEEFDKLVYMKSPEVTTTTGKGLTFQVGDTADDFQKVTLNIKDMSSAGLGIADVNIGDIDSATDAIAKIKDAINLVSSQRGDLGAIQNRLEHTINNLGVQTENITAAESRIRDTDMAEEMMAYTKNNILVQAAQAMLAQANQVPQGILQLLQ